MDSSTYVVIHWPTEEQTKQRVNECKANCGRTCNCKAQNRNAQCARQCQCKKQCLRDIKPSKTNTYWSEVGKQLTKDCSL